MIMPVISSDDIRSIPIEYDVDFKIWWETLTDEIEGSQPHLLEFLNAIYEEYGEHAAICGVLVYKFLQSALSREQCGFS